MSQLAEHLATPPASLNPSLRGPLGACAIYPPGDLDDWQAVEARRAAGQSWREVQADVDKALGIDKHIHLEKFRYHWRRRCACWPSELRLS